MEGNLFSEKASSFSGYALDLKVSIFLAVIII